MPFLTVNTVIAAPPEICFDVSLSVDLHANSMTRYGEHAVAGVRTGGMALDDVVTWRARHFGIWWTMTSRSRHTNGPRDSSTNR